MNYNNNNNNVPTQYYHHDDDDDDNHFDNNNIDDITSQISSKASKVTQMIDNTSNIIIDKNNVKQNTKASVSGVSAIFLLLALISSIGIWILYAYRNPHSTSGQILIKVSYFYKYFNDNNIDNERSKKKDKSRNRRR